MVYLKKKTRSSGRLEACIWAFSLQFAAEGDAGDRPSRMTVPPLQWLQAPLWMVSSQTRMVQTVESYRSLNRCHIVDSLSLLKFRRQTRSNLGLQLRSLV